MHLRPITRSDLPAVARVATACFFDDPLYNFLFPRHATFPETSYSHLLARDRKRFVAAGYWGIACIADDNDKDLAAFARPGDLIGFAWWQRSQSSSAPSTKTPSFAPHPSPYAASNSSPLHALERALLALEARYMRALRPDPARSPAAWAAFEAHLLSYDPFTAAPAHWYLDLLAVMPYAQRRGIGGRLVAWGVRRARAEGVPACLLSTKLGIGLYRKMGFRVVEAMEVEGVDAGVACVWDPWEAWTQEEKEGAVLHGWQVECAWKEGPARGLEEAWRREEGERAGQVMALC